MTLQLPEQDLVGTVIQVEALLHERQYGSDAPLGLRLDRLLRACVKTGQKVPAILRHITADRQVLGDERTTSSAGKCCIVMRVLTVITNLQSAHPTPSSGV